VIVFCGDLQYHDRHKDVLLNPRVIIEALSEETKAFEKSAVAERLCFSFTGAPVYLPLPARRKRRVDFEFADQH
jgi:hypothetical protein